MIADDARRDRAGGRDGRRGQRDLGDDDRRAAGDGDVRSARDPAHRQAAGPAQRGVAPLRARRRRRGHPAREPARGRPCWRAPGGGARGGRGRRPLSAAARSRAACRCRSRGCRAWRASRSRSAQAAEKLAAIGIASAPDGADRLTATVPSFRPDISIEEDLVEEVMRLVGYDRAPARLPRSSGAPAPSPQAFADRARDLLAALGLAEIVSWGFVPARAGWRRWARRLAEGVVGQEPDLGRLRGDAHVAAAGAGWTPPAATSRAASPTSACSRSGPVVWRARRRQGRARRADATRPAILVGRRAGLAEARRRRRFLRRQAGRRSSCCAASASRRRASCRVRDGLLHPGAGAAIHIDGRRRRRSGHVGEVHPRIARALGLEQRARLRRGDARRASRGAAQPIRSVPPPRFPAVTRDISFWIDAGGHRRRAARAAGADGGPAAARPGRAGGLPRSEVRARRQEGDAVDADLSRRRPDADRRRGRRGARARRRAR